MDVQNRLRTMVVQNRLGDLEWDEILLQVDTENVFLEDLDEVTSFFTINLGLPKPLNLVYWRLTDVVNAMDVAEWSVLRAPLVCFLHRSFK